MYHLSQKWPRFCISILHTFKEVPLIMETKFSSTILKISDVFILSVKSSTSVISSHFKSRELNFYSSHFAFIEKVITSCINWSVINITRCNLHAENQMSEKIKKRADIWSNLDIPARLVFDELTGDVFTMPRFGRYFCLALPSAVGAMRVEWCRRRVSDPGVRHEPWELMCVLSLNAFTLIETVENLRKTLLFHNGFRFNLKRL